MDESPLPAPPQRPSRLPWFIVGGLALAGVIGIAVWAGRRPVDPTPDPGATEAQTTVAPDVVELPTELAPLAQMAPALLARFDAAAKAQGFEGWPGLPAEVSTQLKDPTLSRLLANPRALLLIGPEPGRVDALVLVKQVHPKDPSRPYLPLLVRHLESRPVFHQPWGLKDSTPWGATTSCEGDESWGWVEGKTQDHAGTAFPDLMVVRNEPGRFWLAPDGVDGMSIWLYGYKDLLAYELDDLEDAAGKPEHTAEDDIGEGISTIKRTEFDHAKDLGALWTHHLFEVDGNLYAVKQSDWVLWKQGPPATPPTPSSAQEAHP